MYTNVHLLDEYCNAKLHSPQCGKMLNALIKEYKISVDKYISSIVRLLENSNNNNNDNMPNVINNQLSTDILLQFLEIGLPFYYVAVVAELSKLPGNHIHINTAITSITSTNNIHILMRSNINNKYLCAFVNELDDDIDNNNFFIWDQSIDILQNNSVDKLIIQNMSKQTTLFSGIDILLS